jgi:predicted RND superfamily exporter protein
VRGFDDLLPTEQVEKLNVITAIRKTIDKESRYLSDDELAEAEKLRPPDGLREVHDEDVPEELAAPFTEKGGERGRMILADASDNYDTWYVRDLVKFATAVRVLDLGEGIDLGGAQFVFADVIKSMEGDGPIATLVALVGAILVVGAMVGLRRHGAITLGCMTSGALLMLAGAWLAGLKINFLDFVALPITIGIGIDYSVNIVAREKQEGGGSVRHAVATTGVAVALCSFTTIVGYGSLLLSPSGGIRSFGTAAILGEITCLVMALALAPALLQVLARRRQA